MNTFNNEDEGCIEIDFWTSPAKFIRIDMGACDDECKGEQFVEIHRDKVVIKTTLNGEPFDEQEMDFPDFFRMYVEEMAGAADQMRDAMEGK
jgi:hypothetical protein